MGLSTPRVGCKLQILLSYFKQVKNEQLVIPMLSQLEKFLAAVV